MNKRIIGILLNLISFFNWFMFFELIKSNDPKYVTIGIIILLPILYINIFGDFLLFEKEVRQI